MSADTRRICADCGVREDATSPMALCTGKIITSTTHRFAARPTEETSPDQHVFRAQIELRREGEEISAHVSIPGAIVAATGDSMKDALQMLADALDENDQPFWD